MIAVDTNILVRFLVGDDPAQSRRAHNLINENEVCIPLVVLVETTWVLETAYEFSRDDIAKTVRELLVRDDTAIERRAEAVIALDLFEDDELDYADAVIYACGKALGSRDVYTFDEECLATGLFRRPE